MVYSIAQAYGFKEFFSAPAPFCFAYVGYRHCEFNVFSRRKPWNQVEELEHEAYSPS
jgi:hypothetical protein